MDTWLDSPYIYDIYDTNDGDSMTIVTADFTTHGGSHLYGLPYPSANSLDPMDHFCTFYVSKIIPKNMQ